MTTKLENVSGWRPVTSRAINSKLSVAILALLLGSMFQIAGVAGVKDARAEDFSEVANRSLDGLVTVSAVKPEASNGAVAANPQARVKGTPPDSCLKGLPVPVPQGGSHRVIQLVNCSNQVLLGAANAARRFPEPLTPVFPREKTWVLQKAGAPKFGNVLTIDVPTEWENTSVPGSVGPRVWARTGCRYDIASDRAQCETGGCGGVYDCSKAKLSASVGTTVSEWTLYEPVHSGDGKINYFKDSPDISAVDGVNLNMDIQPLNGSARDPFDAEGGHDIQWLAENYPLTVHGQDLRKACLASFQLRRSDLTSGLYGFVIINGQGKVKGGDSTIACFSNCARYAYPTPPDATCDDSDHDSQCYHWKVFCLGDPSQYGKPCKVDSDCPVEGSCWDNPGSANDHTCQGRAFIKAETCPEDVCTFPYGYKDPVNGAVYKSTQPPFGHCDEVSSDPNICIGDDTLHQVEHKAYTWPNDPQVYGGDATSYRVIIAPGGTGGVGITPTSGIPQCSALPKIYDYAGVYGGPKSGTKPCDISVNKDGAVFAVAHPKPASWACNLPPTGSGNEGVICSWHKIGKSK